MGSAGPVLGAAVRPVLELNQKARKAGQEERGAKQLPVLMELAQDESAQAAPEVFAEMIRDATADTGAPLTSIFVDPH